MSKVKVITGSYTDPYNLELLQIYTYLYKYYVFANFPKLFFLFLGEKKAEENKKKDLKEIPPTSVNIKRLNFYDAMRK